MIPATIAKSQITKAVEVLGLNPREITHLTIQPDKIQATVIVKDETGQRIYRDGEYQKRLVEIRITP